MKVSKLWGVWSEGTEGQSLSLIGVYQIEAEAKLAGIGRGAWGGDSKPREVWVILEDDVAWIVKEPEPVRIDTDLIRHKEELKARALAKLSQEERDALGLR